MAELRGVQILQNEIDRSKDRLKGFNENIKKLTGHENPGPRGGRRMFGSESQDYDDKFSGRMGRGRGRLFGLAKRGLAEETGPSVKRRVVGGAFSRLGPAPVQRRVREYSPEEEELPTKLSVHSSVVATSREAKNRQDILQEQTKDKEGMQRNRRMFGLLLGTLNKFKTDSKTMESKEEQRKRIDQKLEENAEKEKKKFKQETMQLMEERHLEQTRISRLEQKMEVVQEHSDREKEMKKLKNFLCTKTKPRIFWKPRQMNTAAENKLKDSIKVVDDMLGASQDRLEKEIKDVMERENKREERIKMRLREDGLFLDEEEKEKENDEKDKIAGNMRVTTDDAEDRIESFGNNERLNDGSDEKSAVRKSKAKRRVVVEEHSDGDSDTEDDDDDDKKKGEDGEIIKKAKKIDEDKEDPKKAKGKSSDDDSDSDSSHDSEDDKKSKNLSKGKLHDKRSRLSHRNEDDRVDNADENSRVVLYRERSKDKTKSEDSKKCSDDERSERKGHGDRNKHSHRRSKHSRKDNESVVVKEEKEERREKKKSKSSERIVVEEESQGKDSGSNKRNTMNLIGEDEDVEMESENNVTI